MQDKIGKEEDEWEEDTDLDEGEVVKLEVGDSIEGMLVDRIRSIKYQAMCYKIKVKDDPIPKVILSTTILEKMMEAKAVGEEVKIERLEDGENQAGVKYSRWKTYHK